ncbi:MULTISPECIES: lactate/malate family dehydrogenase [Olsenella]|mgnify:FL=1|uniref:lactate/malate family dehydrogenase n=1 Tax=Olsenella TaxID=133925 RepID=UPI000783C4EF|nr:MULTISPECIES: L-lactate dehydrogenase [Olsenella]KXB62046.1 lactate/malate dehydrogenase, NAD binding domain protein [Olsenella sp. DNF00959]
MGAPTKIGIIGMGHVGAHVANAILYQGLAAEIYCVDSIESKVACEVNDLQDAMPFYPRQARVYNCHENYEELLGCDVIVNAAGHVAQAAGNRDGELFCTAEETKKWAPRIKGYKGVIVTIANPCDVVATMVWKLAELEPRQVVGSGTALDSARFRHALWDATGYNPNSITSWMIGEHGASQFAAWSHVSFGATPLAELEKSDPKHFSFDKDAIEEAARMGGYVTYAGKQCTEYSVANAATELVKAVVQDSKLITPAGTLLEDVYGESGHYSSIPCVIGKDGVEATFPLELSADEQEKFHASCKHIQDNLEKVRCW